MEPDRQKTRMISIRMYQQRGEARNVFRMCLHLLGDVIKGLQWQGFRGYSGIAGWTVGLDDLESVI